MNLRRKWGQFTRTASVMDLRKTAQQQEVDRIKRKALRHQVLNRTNGAKAVFG